MLLEHDGREQRRLETVGGAVAHDAAKTPQRCAAGRRLGVVGQPVEILLDRERCTAARSAAGIGENLHFKADLKVRTTSDRRGSIGRPFVPGVGLHQLAVGVDDHGPQVVRDVLQVGQVPGNRHAEARRKLVDVVAVAGEERPARGVGAELRRMLLQLSVTGSKLTVAR